MPSAAQRSSTSWTGASRRERELARDRRVVEKLDAVDRGERLARIRGAADHQLAQLDQAALAEPDQVEDAAERDQRLRGADVVGRLLAADVLLARLEREDETAAAVDVGRLAGDAARHAADVLLGRAEESERRAAEVEAPAERLALPHRDVDPALAGRPEHAERHRVDRGDRQRAGVVRGRGERGEVLDAAEEVRVLDEDGGGLVVERFGRARPRR